jgi:hypothetical protein
MQNSERVLKNLVLKTRYGKIFLRLHSTINPRGPRIVDFDRQFSNTVNRQAI